jgi:ATP-dependent helicase HepA
LGANYRGRLFALMICRCNLDDSALQELDVSPGLILRAERFLSPEIQPALFELHLDQIPSAARIGDPRLMAALRSQTELSTRCKLVRPNELNEGLDNVRGLWASAEEAITLALEYVKELRKGITEKASDRLGEDLRSEISYLTWLHKHQSVEQAHQTILEIEARKVLIDSVRREKINLEAVAIIVAS